MKTTDSLSLSFRFEALDIALQASAEAMTLVDGIPAAMRPIGQQAVRAASSIVLNLAEGAGRVGRDRVHLFRIAYGSAKETSAALALLQRMGAIDSAQAEQTTSLLDRVQAMTWRLCHR